MWTCPHCQQQFYNRNQSHSCGQYSVDGFLENKSERSIELFWYFLAEYKRIGVFELHPVKTRVALLAQMRFASVNRLGKDFLDGHLVLIDSNPDKFVFHKIDNLNNRFFVHHFRIYREEEIGATFRHYMRLAYEVGHRKHVIPGKKANKVK
jgi:hypothetical protein